MDSSQPMILAIDDDPVFRRYLYELLHSSGYGVIEAADGLEALEVLQQSKIDLILADVAMPRLNGYQLFEQLSEHPTWSSIPFIFLSARAMDSDIRYAKEKGVDDYLVKNVGVDDLLATVRGKLVLARRYARARSAARPPSVSSVGVMLEVGALRMDVQRHTVWFQGEQRRLSSREFQLLYCLAERATAVVPMRELIEMTHGQRVDEVEAGRLLRPLVRSLRRKFGYEAGEAGFIESVRGVGYRLLLPPTD